MKVNILFPFKNGPWGGGNQFLKALRGALERMGVYTHNVEDADVILVNAFPSNHTEIFLKAILHKTKRHAKIIYRLDGLYYRNRLNENHRNIDDICTVFANNFADGIVYQTEWVKDIQQEYGIYASIPFITALNAPDASIFTPRKQFPNIEEKIKLIATCWAPNKRKGFDTYKWLDDNLDFSKYDLTFVGRHNSTPFKNIKHLEPMVSEKLAQELEKHHIFISAAFDEPCSNSLIEAMNVGLIPIGHNSGGTPEIIGTRGYTFTQDNELLDLIDKTADNYKQLLQEVSNILHIDDVAKQYYNFMCACPKKPLTELSAKDFKTLLKEHKFYEYAFAKWVKNMLRPLKRRALSILRKA